MTDRVVLAYSGGLDTTVAVRWLREERDLDVVAVAVDVGQASDLEAIAKRAKESGAVEAIVVDATEEFANDFLNPALAANVLYQGKYPLVSALSRPCISRHLVEAARSTGARYIAHGCTGKGNDQVRFEVSLGALAPDMEVLAPVRDWGMTREESISYGLEGGLDVPQAKSSSYSIDENLWGRTIECGALEDPFEEPPQDVWERTSDPAQAPREPAYLQVGFSRGVPVSLDGAAMGLAQLIKRTEDIAGSFGFGRVDMIEDRVVGIKSREIYEVPAALSLIMAHSDLEELTLDREVLRTKRQLEVRYAQLVYEGGWFSPLREAMDAFIATTAPQVDGVVRLRYEAGGVRVVGRKSPHSLYDLGLATYESGDTFDHSSGEGFGRIWGLPLRVWGQKRDGRKDG
jgi:argininosuccinate synthase